MKEFYQNALRTAQTQDKLAVRGLLDTVGQLFMDAADDVSRNELTFEYVCSIADKLNAMLGAIEGIRKSIADNKQALAKIEKEEIENA